MEALARFFGFQDILLDNAIRKYIINRDLSDTYIDFKSITAAYLDFFQTEKEKIKKSRGYKTSSELHRGVERKINNYYIIWSNILSSYSDIVIDDKVYSEIALSWISSLESKRKISLHEYAEIVTSVLLPSFLYPVLKTYAVDIKDNIMDGAFSCDIKYTLDKYLRKVIPVMFNVSFNNTRRFDVI